jgi:single-strand DNA-binding protein
MVTIGLARIGNEPVVKYTADGKPVMELSLAYDYGRKDQTGKRATQWINATMFGDRAEKLAPYLHKGNQLMVTLNDLHVETYTKKDGVTGVSLKAKISEVELLAKTKETVEPVAKPATFTDIPDDMPF